MSACETLRDYATFIRKAWDDSAGMLGPAAASELERIADVLAAANAEIELLRGAIEDVTKWLERGRTMYSTEFFIEELHRVLHENRVLARSSHPTHESSADKRAEEA